MSTPAPTSSTTTDTGTATATAAVVPALGEPLVIQERPVPAPGPGEVLVRIEASGLCHTDIHAARGDWPVKPTPPFVPGHEGVGIVEAVGPGATAHAVGTRVALPWLGQACGSCSYCVSGWETLCESQVNTGYGRDGGYATHVVASAAYAVAVPDGIDPLDAAPLTCAGVTTYKAVKVARPQPAETVAVFGIGGLGHLALQYARVFGSRTVAVDVEDAKLALATELGADEVVDARSGDAGEAVTALGGADVAVVTAASPEVMEQAHRSLRRGGRLVLVGLPKDNHMSLDVFATVLKGITVIGSIVGTREDLAEVFRLHARGRTRVVRETRSLEQVNECFEEILSGRVPARLVFRM
jgi:propanol-preferring alcohol dehydrogenase